MKKNRNPDQETQRSDSTETKLAVAPNTPTKHQNLPSVDTLALLAAIITPSKEQTHEQRVEEALFLWQAAKVILDEEVRDDLQWDEVHKMIEAIPQPKKYPASLDECLRCLMPKVDKTNDRFNRFRHFLGETEKDDFGDPIGWENTGDIIAKMKMQEFDPYDLLGLSQKFSRWWKNKVSEQRRTIGLKAKKSPPSPPPR
jgi:hypothetical protein